MEDLEKYHVKLIDTVEIDLFTELPFKWYIIEDFSEEHSFATIMFNHAWMDGLCYLAKLYVLKKDKHTAAKKRMPVPPKPSIVQRMAASIVVPFYSLKMMTEFALMPFQNHAGGGFTVTLQKPCTFSYKMDFDRKIFEKRCKEIKTSSTLMGHSIFGQTLYEYSK